jgi:ParB/RepB/Spo0J family partition protein
MITLPFHALPEAQRAAIESLDIEDFAEAKYVMDDSREDRAVVMIEVPTMFDRGQAVRWAPPSRIYRDNPQTGKTPFVISADGKMRIVFMDKVNEALRRMVGTPATGEVAPAPAGDVHSHALRATEMYPEAPVLLPLADILPGPNPRTHFSPEKHAELKTSMRVHGFLPMHPLLVRPHPEHVGKWQLVFGQRRWRCAVELVKEKALRVGGSEQGGELTQSVLCVAKPISAARAAELQVIENDQREDFLPTERALAYERLLAMRDEEGAPIFTEETLAQRLGRKPRWVRAIRSLARVAETEVGRALDEGKIKQTLAVELARIPTKGDRARSLDWVLGSDPAGAPKPVEALQIYLKEQMRELKTRIFPMDDAALLPIQRDEAGRRTMGGACTDCEWNSANFAEDARGAMASGQSKAPLCLNMECYRAKQAAVHEQWRAKVGATALRGGKTTLPAEENAQAFNSSGVRLAEAGGMVEFHEPPSTWDLRKGTTCEQPWRVLTQGQEVPLTLVMDAHRKEHVIAPRALCLAAAIANGHEVLFRQGAKAAAGTTDAGRKEEAKPAGSTESSLAVEPVGAARSMDREAAAKAKTLKTAREQEREARRESALLNALRDRAAAVKRPDRSFWALLIAPMAEMIASIDKQHGTALLAGVTGLFGMQCAEGDEVAEMEQFAAEAPEHQVQALVVMLGHALMYDDSRAAWVSTAVKLFSIDEESLKKRVDEALAAEWAAADVREQIASGMVWTGERTKAGEFNWEGGTAQNPETCHLAMPAKCKLEARIHVARDAKGWHEGWSVSAGRKAAEQHSAPCSIHEASYSNRALALRSGLLALADWLRTALAPERRDREAILERIAAYTAAVEGGGK